MIKDLVDLFADVRGEVFGMDALGFVLAGPVAIEMRKPLILFRKEGG